MAWRPKSLYEPHDAEAGDSAGAKTAGVQSAVRFVFTQGIDRSVSPSLIADGACRYLLNMWYPKETVPPRTRPGLVAYFAGTPATGAIRALFVYQKDASTVFTVAAVEDDPDTPTELLLYYVDGTGELALIDSGSASGGLGSVAIPSFKTVNGRLLVAQPTKYLREWAGLEDGETAAAQATGTVTIADNPDLAEGDTVTVGVRTYTFYTARSQPGEVTLGANAAATATNLVAAIATDSWDVEAVVDATTTHQVNVTARRHGVVGNAYPLAKYVALDMTAITLSGALLTGGVDGAVLDEIDTYLAPKSGIVGGDRKGRVVAFGDATNPDRLYFSSPGNEWSWAASTYGNGEYIDVGHQEGNTPSAVVPFGDELWLHKTGQNREIYRADVDDVDPANWLVSTRAYEDTNAALNHRCAVSVAEQHVVLDDGYLGTYSGTDTYDEIRSGLDYNKVHDLLGSINPATAFIAKHPGARVLLVFEAAGPSCVVYHYGTRRWSTWRFAGGLNITCGCYHESAGFMLLGATDGMIYKLDDSVATDDGYEYPSVALGKTLQNSDLAQINWLQTMLDYENLALGAGYFAVALDRVESGDALFSFETTVKDKRIYEYAATEIYALALVFIASSPYGRTNSYQQANGEMMAPMVVLQRGAIVLNSVTAKVTNHGRAAK